MISYLQAVNVIKTFADDHLQINRFDFEFKEQMQNLATLNEAYPFLYVVPLASDTITNVNEFEVEIYCVDRLQKDRTNVNYVVSDTNQILNDLVLWLEEGQDDIEIVGTATQTPINNDLLDYVGGWVLRVRLQVEKIGLCEIPLGGEMPPPPTCENATFQNSDESFVTTIASGDTYTSDDIRVYVYDQNTNLLATVDSPSNINVNAVVEVTNKIEANVINSLDEIVNTAVVTTDNPNISAPDAHLRIKKSGGTDIVEIDLPSGSDEVQIISDSVITLKDSSGTTISTTNVQATETANITAPDGLININGSSVGSVKSNGIRNLFVKLNGTNSGVYNGVDTINVTSPTPTVKGAEQLKTFQTTSYSTGDDGNVQQGRGTSHLLLGWTNKFGNNNRFTDFIGITTYANGIVLDHQQDNGTTIMAYYKPSLLLSNDSYANNMAYCNALNVSGFTGWRMTNVRQLEVLMDYEKTNILDFAPFNAGGAQVHSSTTYKPSTTLCHALNGSYMSVLGKGASTAKCLPCRRFTYAELGL